MSNQPTATASASVVFPFATIAVVFLIIAKTQNLWGLGDLSWIWVFAPWWMGFVFLLGLVLIFAVFGGIALGIAWLVDRRSNKKREKARQERIVERKNNLR